ncbi:hypothetical protein F3Y22_tig00110602pilonHSYRG00133 [Hibiscus syriacus]|uniref:Uncharacterized protein n=1 Tax=Hibiscus syriacus TaxID=106335 RepID=A0A6A3A4C4_HIBSY|nr:UPF0481 protein At3g47200-like [Hibiscus syriacus]KAE8698095.1 hypothetical protein F3Y22_tig00110602pilonHSYRG00133 [Hibiscus syriacus]
MDSLQFPVKQVYDDDDGIQAKPEKSMEEDFIEQVCDDGNKCCNPCIFRTPFPGLQFQEPQLASIGPFHCTKTLPLQQYKYSFLHSFVSRVKRRDKDLRFFVRQMTALERRARRCYSEEVSMSSPEFVESMLVDGCFVMEVLLGNFGGGSEDWRFPIEPWQLPILVQDLLILENQIPFFVLEMLFESLGSQGQEGSPAVSLCTMALKFFDLVFPRSTDISCEFDHLEPHHLLDLFLQSIRPLDPSRFHMKTTIFPNFVYSLLKKLDVRNQADASKKVDNVTNLKLKGVEHEQQCDPLPPFHLTMNVTELQASVIKLRPRNVARFTDIDFKNGVLGIPSITIDDLFIAILVNCVAFEHSSKTGSKDLTAYVSFMSRLMKRPADAELLCSNEIISSFSHNDPKVVKSFHFLWLHIPYFDVQHSYLSKRLKELECYYTRYEKARWWSSFVSRYWTTLFFCITNLLFDFNHLRSGVNLMIHLVVQQVKFNGIYPEFEGNTNITCPQDYSSFICYSVFCVARFIYNRVRGRVKSMDLSLSKFTAFLFIIVVIVIMMFVVSETPTPTLTVDKQVIDDENSVTVEGSSRVNEKHVGAKDKQIEVENPSKRRDTSRVPWLSETVSGEKYEIIVDCVSKDKDDKYYNEPWRRILEHEVVRMLVSALRVA